MDFLQLAGKSVLVFGLANRKSVAWHIGQVLAAAGASKENADTVAAHLVSANLSGVDTHGVRHIPGYVRDLAAGFIDGKAQPTTLRSGPSSLLVSGNWTFGQVAARFAAIRIASPCSG